MEKLCLALFVVIHPRIGMERRNQTTGEYPNDTSRITQTIDSGGGDGSIASRTSAPDRCQGHKCEA